MLSGEYRETAGDSVDAEAGHCGAYGNENTVTGGMQLHVTTSGWIHGDTQWMGTRLLHESIDGVSFPLGMRFQPRMIKEISVPPSALAGRGGAIRLRGGTVDLGILAYYSPPSGGCSRARRKVQVKASQHLMDWVRNRISSWPSRVFPLAAGDLNSGVGMFRDGTQAEGPSVGNSQLSAQNEAGNNFVEMAMSLELGILNTMWHTGGPTYCGLAGYRSTIDYILAPLSGLVCEESSNLLEVGA